MKITISCGQHDIILTDDIHDALSVACRHLSPFPDKIFILSDTNTSKACYPVLATWPELELTQIIIPAGEQHKNLDTCKFIWNELLREGASRQSLLINLGGGMVTDIGGFTASVYMRGIRFIHIPTSLTGMVDASAGGKTGIDWNGYKNIIGTFSFPETVLADPRFLNTLPDKEWKNGFAEILKHGLISESDLLEDFFNHFEQHEKFDDPYTRSIILGCIEKSIRIKAEIINRDPFEKNQRKFLNFGHTIGHAIESHALLNDQQPLSHGSAVAIGLICECFISSRITGLSPEVPGVLASLVKSIFPYYPLMENNFGHYIDYMTSDKKSSGGSITMTLLKAPGKPVISDIESTEIIIAAFDYYNSQFLV